MARHASLIGSAGIRNKQSFCVARSQSWALAALQEPRDRGLRAIKSCVVLPDVVLARALCETIGLILYCAIQYVLYYAFRPCWSTIIHILPQLEDCNLTTDMVNPASAALYFFSASNVLSIPSPTTGQDMGDIDDLCLEDLFFFPFSFSFKNFVCFSSSRSFQAKRPKTLGKQRYSETLEAKQALSRTDAREARVRQCRDCSPFPLELTAERAQTPSARWCT